MNRPCPDCTEKGHPGFRDPRHSDAFCRTCEGDGGLTADDAVQSMRDQGIRDACEGRKPLYWIAVGGVWASDGDEAQLLSQDDEEYRAAFAYARAYEANAKGQP